MKETDNSSGGSRISQTPTYYLANFLKKLNENAKKKSPEDQGAFPTQIRHCVGQKPHDTLVLLGIVSVNPNQSGHFNTYDSNLS